MRLKFADFAEIIDLARVRIRATPDFVFLCGGTIDRSKPSFCSVRHFIYAHLEHTDKEMFSTVIRAEEVIEWYYSGYYADLLDLERDLAGLSAAIVLFVESPGSIAELGSFVIDEEIAEKLVIFIMSDHMSKRSYISTGPIGYFQERHPDYILPYPWADDATTGSLDIKTVEPYVEEIVDAIKKKSDDRPSEKKFNIENRSHHLLLLADLIYVFEIVRLGEIKDAMSHIVGETTEKDIRKYLNILIKLNVIRLCQVGHDTYYTFYKPLYYMSYAFEPTAARASRDISRWRMSFRQLHRATDIRRVRACGHSTSTPGAAR